jgi:hypothetical protein
MELFKIFDWKTISVRFSQSLGSNKVRKYAHFKIILMWTSCLEAEQV